MKKIAIIAAVVLIVVYLLKNKGTVILSQLQAAPNDPNNQATGGAKSPVVESGSLGVPLPNSPIILINGSSDDWAPVSTDGFEAPPMGSIGVPQP